MYTELVTSLSLVDFEPRDEAQASRLQLPNINPELDGDDVNDDPEALDTDADEDDEDNGLDMDLSNGP